MPVVWKEEMKSGKMPKQRKGNPNLGMIPTECVQKEALFFSLAAQALHWHTVFLVVTCGLSSPEAYVILVPYPGIQPTSPALEGGFLTTESPGKFQGLYF